MKKLAAFWLIYDSNRRGEPDETRGRIASAIVAYRAVYGAPS